MIQVGPKTKNILVTALIRLLSPLHRTRFRLLVLEKVPQVKLQTKLRKNPNVINYKNIFQEDYENLKRSFQLELTNTGPLIT